MQFLGRGIKSFSHLVFRNEGCSDSKQWLTGAAFLARGEFELQCRPKCFLVNFELPSMPI